MLWCEGCLMRGLYVPATTRSIHPEYSGYVLCEDCAEKYDLLLFCDETASEAKRLGKPSARFTSFHVGGGGAFTVKHGGKHYQGCVCDICGAADGKHGRLCTCPYCGGKGGEHNPGCFCPQCFGQRGEHNAHCECPVCHRLG